jgi:hypothetical protein
MNTRYMLSSKGGRIMTKVVTLEVKVTLPKTVTEGIDHMIEVGKVELLNTALGWPQPPVVDPVKAKTTVPMSVSDSKVIECSEDHH